MISLLIAIAPVIVQFALSILGSVLMKNSADNDAVKAWYKIIETVRAAGLISNDLHNKYQKMVKTAEDRAAEEWEKRNKPKPPVSS